MDTMTRIIDAAIDHWPLVVAVVVSGWWVFPRMLRESLSNGGGDIIRRIVAEENGKQTVIHAKDLEDRFERHEEQEDRRFRSIEEEVFRRHRR